MLIIKRIHVVYELEVDDAIDAETVERVHGFHADQCPVARSVGGCIDITTELRLVGVA